MHMLYEFEVCTCIVKGFIDDFLKADSINVQRTLPNSFIITYNRNARGLYRMPEDSTKKS